MITKEIIKAEVDRVQNKDLEVLYKIVKALASPLANEGTADLSRDTDWSEFIETTYGCLANAPIERGEQGQFEVREALA